MSSPQKVQSHCYLRPGTRSAVAAGFELGPCGAPPPRQPRFRHHSSESRPPPSRDRTDKPRLLTAPEPQRRPLRSAAERRMVNCRHAHRKLRRWRVQPAACDPATVWHRRPLEGRQGRRSERQVRGFACRSPSRGKRHLFGNARGVHLAPQEGRLGRGRALLRELREPARANGQRQFHLQGTAFPGIYPVLDERAVLICYRAGVQVGIEVYLPTSGWCLSSAIPQNRAFTVVWARIGRRQSRIARDSLSELK